MNYRLFFQLICLVFISACGQAIKPNQDSVLTADSLATRILKPGHQAWDFGPPERHDPAYRTPNSQGVLRVDGNPAPRVFSDIPARSLATSDGLYADEIRLKISELRQNSMLILSLDSGVQDRVSTVISVDGVVVAQDWSSFRTPPEPRKRSKNTMYFALLPLDPDSVGNEIVISNASGARLLSAELFPNTDIRETLETLEAFEPTFELTRDYFLSVAQQLRDAHPNTHFAEFLADIMVRAEDFTQKMGWEWATEATGLGIFDRYHQVVQLWDMLIQVLPQDSAWQDRARFERARVMMWLWREQRGEPEYRRYREDIQYLVSKYPGSDRIKMYAGIEVPNPDHAKPKTDMHAPPWSQKQLQVIHELRSIAHWWVNERQAENGELGGKLGDDVELMRWWPILTMLDDATTIRGWEKLAREVWQSKKVKNGYSSRPIDVEHASEYIADTAPMMAYFSSANWLQQLRFNTENFRHWTAQDKDGDTFFRSAWFSYREVDETPPKNRDLDMNGRAVKPIRFLAYLEQDPEATAQVVSWARAWTKLALREDKGKPLGVFPVSYRVSDSSVNGDQDNWYRADMFWDYFEWEAHPGTKLYQHLLVAYLLSGDKQLLQPMALSLELIEKHADDTRQFAPGSQGWAANILANKNSFWKSASEWRMLSQDKRYDSLILEHAEGYIRYRITGDESEFNRSLRSLLHGLSHNRPLQQEEVLFTDRVFLGANRSAGYPSLFAMLTGDISTGNSPLSHVTWQEVPRGFTALVKAEDPASVQAQVFIHQQRINERRQKIGMRLWRLPMGHVTLELHKGNALVKTHTVKLEKRGQVIWLDLDAGEAYQIEVNTPSS